MIAVQAEIAGSEYFGAEDGIISGADITDKRYQRIHDPWECKLVLSSS